MRTIYNIFLLLIGHASQRHDEPDQIVRDVTVAKRENVMAVKRNREAVRELIEETLCKLEADGAKENH